MFMILGLQRRIGRRYSHVLFTVADDSSSSESSTPIIISNRHYNGPGNSKAKIMLIYRVSQQVLDGKLSLKCQSHEK